MSIQVKIDMSIKGKRETEDAGVRERQSEREGTRKYTRNVYASEDRHVCEPR